MQTFHSHSHPPNTLTLATSHGPLTEGLIQAQLPRPPEISVAFRPEKHSPRSPTTVADTLHEGKERREPGNACEARPETGTLLLWPPRGRAQAVVLAAITPEPSSPPSPCAEGRPSSSARGSGGRAGARPSFQAPRRWRARLRLHCQVRGRRDGDTMARASPHTSR